MRLDLVVNTFIKDALLRGKLFLHGGGWMWRPLVDIHDVAEAHLRCIEASAGSVGGEIFNVVHENFQIRQLAMLVAGSLSLRGRVVALEDAPVPAINRDYRCANRKLADRLGFAEKIRRGAFADAIRDGDPFLVFAHDSTAILARKYPEIRGALAAFRQAQTDAVGEAPE